MKAADETPAKKAKLDPPSTPQAEKTLISSVASPSLPAEVRGSSQGQGHVYRRSGRQRTKGQKFLEIFMTLAECGIPLVINLSVHPIRRKWPRPYYAL